MTRIILTLALTASAFTPPTHSRPPTQLAAGFGKTTKSKDKAVQIKGAPKPMDKLRAASLHSMSRGDGVKVD